jgi:hypothetical protein
MELPDIEIVCAKVHANYVQERKNKGVTSEKSDKTGQELLAPFGGLQEEDKQVIREQVGVVYNAIRDSANARPDA